MKISFFSTSTEFSGGRHVMFGHAKELARRGHEVRIWVQKLVAGLNWIELEVPLRALPNGSLNDVDAADVRVFDRPRLAALLWRAGAHRAVHLCQGLEMTDAELRLRSAWRQGGWRALPEIWRLRRRLHSLKRAYALRTIKLVTHRHIGEEIGRRFGQPSYLVPLGLPEGVFTPPPSRPPEATTVLVVGPTDIACKRIPDALRAVQLLKRQRPDVRLVRVAQHPMRDEESRLGVTDEYYTMLRPAEMAERYRKADVLLCSSDANEGFGLPVLEGMACGLPCVLTDIPAFRTFAAPDNYADFVPVGDPEQMAAAMGSLLDDFQARQELSRRGLQVAAEYTMRRSYDMMEAVLVELAIAAGCVARRPAGSYRPFRSRAG
jgi:glycosyltransferase involved in cell wall biosynthesis